ncbi:GNAT family N-acetyltransferase [Antribacter sp. KLBMP9083]|uniref:GNAT family N-acetyltransferase n=1 Tax=Antribacter soli TaxID=2910976 RepID=A0AA41QGH7_9MICO|nr:GNAT family N-acetyltransferase [Antribacter soli]MCF4122696.1 GNAT family N-acetyltransferase [Antribacter soli]
MSEPVVRRVRADEWQQVRDLRLRALQDEVAAIAFVDSYEEALARPDAFWQERAARAAAGDAACQVVAVVDGDWVGTVTVLVSSAGRSDDPGNAARGARASLVGVYVDPRHRGTGVVETLLAEAVAWARSLGLDDVRLHVHEDNGRAQAAYRRCGFVLTGKRVEASVGAELEMALA